MLRNSKINRFYNAISLRFIKQKFGVISKVFLHIK